MKNSGKKTGTGAGKRPAATRAKPVKAKAPVIDRKSQLLSLLTILVKERSGLKQNEIVNALVPRASDLKSSDTAALARFLERAAELPPQKEKLLKAFLAQRLEEIFAGQDGHVLARDLGFLRGAVAAELGVKIAELTGRNDQTQFDQELLDILKVKAYDPQMVLNSARGFWYVVRCSTLNGENGGGPALTVSLLTVKELDYLPVRHGERATRMLSHMPHFSLRSARYASDGETGAKPHIFRGWVIHTLHPTPVLNFFGARQDDYAPLFMMTLRMSNLMEHATEARGVTISSNKQTLFAGPVAACYITASDDLHKLRQSPIEDEQRDLQETERYRELRDRLMKHVGRFDTAEILTRLSEFCNAEAVHNAAEWLSTCKRNAAADRWGGVYLVPPD